MSRRRKPTISPYAGTDWTRITFEPDLAKFGMQKFDEDVLKLFERRVYDIAGVTRDCKVGYNIMIIFVLRTGT